MAKPTLSQALAAVVRERREELGLSQESIPGIHRNTVGSFERAQRNPSIEMLDRFARALDTTGSALLAEAEKRVGRKRY